jgi:tRNA-guanine family transglycosylase
MKTTKTVRYLQTRHGNISLPAYVPVTTFGEEHPLDRLIQPYLPRLAQAMMVSYYYAKQMKSIPLLPLMIDSGGFASLFSHTELVVEEGLGLMRIARDEEVETIHPRDILEYQESVADVAFTLDFPIPPSMKANDAQLRQELTIANAIWAIENRRRNDMLLFAVVQAWDLASARECAQIYRQYPFDGIAIGGLVPRVRDMKLVLDIVHTVRNEIGDLPLHVLGLGKPEIVSQLFGAGVDSVDSSSYVQMAADGRIWNNPDFRIDDASISDRLHIALCNLAMATATAIPLSASRLLVKTASLVR